MEDIDGRKEKTPGRLSAPELLQTPVDVLPAYYFG